MRIFNKESMWDAENQRWYDTYSIDGHPVNEETYYEQLEVEMLVADDDMELEEEFCKCCNCEVEDCEELTDWQKQIIDIVEDFAYRIEHEIEEDCLCECGCTLRNMLVDMFYQARQIGFEDGVECGIESVEEKTVNINIDNLTVDSGNARDFVEQLKELSRRTSINI